MSEAPECPACGREFDSRQSVGIHYSAKHDDDGPMKDHLLAELRELAGQIGRTPKKGDVQDSDISTTVTYANYFGSWNNAVREAGLETVRDMNIGRQDLLDELHRLDREHEEVTRQVLDEYGKFCQSPYVREFGTWAGALEAAGIDLVQAASVTKEEVKADLKAVCEELGHAPTQAKYRELGTHSTLSVQNYLGGWNAAIEGLGYEVNQRRGIPTEELIAELKRLRDKYGRSPFVSDMKRDGKFSDFLYYSRFGSWPAALDAADMDPVKIAGENHPCWEPDSESLTYGPGWGGARVRCLERDDYECQSCGCTLEEHTEEFGRSLDVHHIDGHHQNHDLSNLITLCRPCHLGTWQPMTPLRPDTTGTSD